MKEQTGSTGKRKTFKKMDNSKINSFSDIVCGFVGGSFTASNGFSIPYRLYMPTLEKGKTYPLILYFHGAGSWTENNTAQLEQAKRLVRKDYPAFILAPKTSQPMKWVDLDWRKCEHTQPVQPGKSLFAAGELLLKTIRDNPAVDIRRIYVNGQSMGAYGVWDMITRYPEIFAAAVPICGGGDAGKMTKLKDMPVWIFHGAGDSVVPVQNSRKLAAALKKAGNQQVRYTEYPDVDHDAWVPAYNDDKLFRWFFSQIKKP